MLLIMLESLASEFKERGAFINPSAVSALQQVQVEGVLHPTDKIRAGGNVSQSSC